MHPRITGFWVIARTTYAETVRRPIYYLVLIPFCLLIFLSQYITLFSFYTEMNMIREVGVATFTLWAFIILIVTTGLAVTAELDNRTAVAVLAKPLGRSSFLLGKYFGLLAALLIGMFMLALVLLCTLWIGFGVEHLDSPECTCARFFGGDGVLAFIWESFLMVNGVVVLEGLLLSFFQVAVLGALCVSLAAFFPTIFTVAATALIFIIGNMSAYMLGSIEKLDAAALTAVVRLATYLFPNLGYFNLQSHFSEGRIVSFEYMAAATCYTALYVTLVFFLAGTLFARREIR